VQAELQVTYRDTAAADLVWRLGDPRRPALATLVLPVPAGHLELRLLGSSHQVILVRGTESEDATSGVAVSEVVACGAGAPGLPAAARQDLDGWDYRFRSSVRRLPSHRFEYWVDRLVTRLAHHPAALVGRFPGSPYAVTALLAGPGSRPGGGQVGWRTWHAYPQEARIVTTTTTVRPR